MNISSYSWILVIAIITFADDVSLDNWESLNEYDTYYADECPRVRRGWHTLSDEERGLFVSGLLKLRENGEQNMDIDELIAIGSVHADGYASFTHKTSSYLYWHGYLIWELESRIRNLGDEYKCFGMPYWDFTLEVGHESDPLIFNTGLGGNGDINDHYNVNEYSWPSVTTQMFWQPDDCQAEGDQYPICSLKRALRSDFQMTTVQELGASLINAPNFEDLYHYLHISGHAVHLIDGDDSLDEDGNDVYQFQQSYEPIWYLFHSMVQYHQGIWTDCNNYDQIPIDELDNFPEAFTEICNPDNPNDYPDEWLECSLDSPLHFGGKLIDNEWSFINSEDLTVRKLYSLPSWNIVYDLGNGDGFFTDSGLKDYCQGKLNTSWFILNENDDAQELISSNSKQPSIMIIFCLLLSSICFGTYYVMKHKILNKDNWDEMVGINKHLDKYGTFV